MTNIDGLTKIEYLCQRLQLAAMREKRTPVMVDYAGHVDYFTVAAYPAETNFNAPIDEWPDTLVRQAVRLQDSTAADELTEIAEKLIEMGVEV